MKKMKPTWGMASGLLLLIICLTGLATVDHYGSSWDEQVRAEAGELKFDYYRNLLSGNFGQARDFAARADNYPGFHDLNLAILKQCLPIRPELAGHLFSLVLGILGIAGAMRLATLLAEGRAGFLTGLILSLTPSYYGHMFINPKDIPFAFGYVWSIYWIARWIREGGSSTPWKTVILTGTFIGVTTACRIGGLVLFCYLGLFLLLRIVMEAHLGNEGIRKGILNGLRKTLLPVAAAVAISMIILWLYWPALHSNPFGKASGTLARVTQFTWSMPVLFEGDYLAVDQLPWYYILKMLLIKIPAGYLAILAGGTFLFVRGFQHQQPLERIRAHFPGIFISFSILFPLFYVIARDSTLYNGIRHLLFIVPPLAVAAGISLDKLLRMATASSVRNSRLAWAAVSVYFGLVGLSQVRLHPYQYIYYNELAGGTAAASRSYETDYWGTVYRELAEGLYAHLVTTRPAFSGPDVVINMEHVTWLFEPYLPASRSLPLRFTRSQPQSDDYYAASTAWAADRYYHGTPVVVVERSGIILGIVKDRRGLTLAERALGYEPAP